MDKSDEKCPGEEITLPVQITGSSGNFPDSFPHMIMWITNSQNLILCIAKRYVPLPRPSLNLLGCPGSWYICHCCGIVIPDFYQITFQMMSLMQQGQSYGLKFIDFFSMPLSGTFEDHIANKVYLFLWGTVPAWLTVHCGTFPFLFGVYCACLLFMCCNTMFY